jgi:hypothetical protein
VADLDQLFANLDRLDTSVSWRDVKGRPPGPRLSDSERLKKILVATLALAVAAAGITLALRAFVFAGGRKASPAPSPTSEVSPSPSPPPPGWVPHDDEAGVSIDTPADWTFNDAPVPVLAEPGMLFAVGTGPVPTGGDCAPTAAIDEIPPDGTLFVVQEYGSVDEPYTFPPRPDHFDLGSLLGPFECFGVEAHDVLFQDGGRFFQVSPCLAPTRRMRFGRRLRTRWTPCRWTRSQAVSSLLPTAEPAPGRRVPKRRGLPGDQRSSGVPPWTPGGPSNPRAGRKALVRHLDHSLSGDLPSGNCQSVASASVCQVGDRLVWEAQGLLVWIEPAPSPYDSLRTNPGLPTGASLGRLVGASQRVRLVQP